MFHKIVRYIRLKHEAIIEFEICALRYGIYGNASDTVGIGTCSSDPAIMRCTWTEDQHARHESAKCWYSSTMDLERWQREPHAGGLLTALHSSWVWARLEILGPFS